MEQCGGSLQEKKKRRQVRKKSRLLKKVIKICTKEGAVRNRKMLDK